MNSWKLTKARLSAVLVTAITAGLLGPVAVVSPAAAEEVASSPAGTPNPSVAQMTGVSISGTLSYFDEATGLPVPITVGNGFVDLYNSEGWYDVANPDAEGFYSFSDLPAGTYYLKASYSGQDVESMPSEWYADKPSRGVATAVTVASTVVANRDITLAPGGQISGTLVNAAADPVAFAKVCALSVTPTPALAEGEDYWCGTSGESGDYVISNLPNGDFRLYIDTSDVFDATEMRVGGGWIGASGVVSTFATAATQTIASTGGTELTGRNATLVAPATISGVVKYFPTTATAVPAVMAGVTVAIYDLLGHVVGWDQTGDNGSYTIFTMGPGLYYLGASDDAGLYPKVPDADPLVLVADEYYQDKPDLAVVDPPITMGSSNLTGYNMNLAYGASIKGTVTKPNGRNPLAVAEVEVCPFVTEFIQYGECVLTDSLGNYDIAGLPNGSYKLFFYGEGVGLKNKWLGPSDTYATASPKTVSTTGAGHTGQNVTLDILPSIKGQVTYQDATDVGLQGAVVEFYDSQCDLVDSVVTDENGNYTYFTEATGPVRIFADPSIADYYGQGALAPEWFTDVPDCSLAESISPSISPSAQANQANIRLAPGASISGSVSYLTPEDELGDFLEVFVDGVRVCAYFSETLDPFACGTSDESGFYTIEGLPNGVYRLEFDTTGASVPLTTSWKGLGYSNPQTSYDLAEPQTISTEGVSLQERDLRLPLGTLDADIPTISGTPEVGSTLTGDPGEWGPVGVELVSEWLRGTTVVARGLEYVVRPADMGNWLTFRVTGSMEFYTTASRASAAVEVPVEPHINGQVTYTGSVYNDQTDVYENVAVGLAGATVEIHDAETGDFVDSVTSDGGGNYIYIPEGRGRFKLFVDPSSAEYFGGEPALAPEWFTNVPDLSLATAIPFTTRTVTGKNVHLAPEATISGSVWYLSSENVQIPVGDVVVCAYFLATEEPFNCGMSDESGFYTIEGLPNGNYKLEFDTTNAYGAEYQPVQLLTSWLGQYDSDAVDSYASATAQSISTAGDSLENKNVQLPEFTFDTTPIPTIAGTATFGQTLTATEGDWDPATELFTYQWMRGGSNISSATAKTYVLTDADIGYPITVKVSGVMAGYRSSPQTSVATANVAGTPYTLSPAPTITGSVVPGQITGSVVVGQVLTANKGTWTPAPASYTYQWRRDDENIESATAPTYTVTLDDLDSRISVVVTPVKSGYEKVTRTSLSTAAVTLPLIASAPTPTIMGPVKFDSPLTVQAGTPTLGATVKSYQWSSAATLTGSFTPIEGATANTYVLTASDVDKFIRVTVTWQKSGNADTPKTATTTVKVAALTFATPPVPTITGTKTVGQTLTAVPGTWSPVPAFTYQWSSSATATGVYAPISGATNPTYQLTSTELGKFVKVTVTGTKAGYATLNVLSAAMTSAVVQAFTTAPTPTISGTVQVGQTLTAVPGTWSPVPAFTYQWKRNGSIITGATAYTYVLTAADRGAVISVDVKGTLATYEPTTKTSADTVEVASGVFTTASTPTITGSAALGSTLTAATVAWAPVATLTYAWYADDVVIPGATLATYMLPLTGTSMVGKQITVKVTGALSGYTSQTKTSDPTAAVTLALIPAAPTPTIMGPVKVGSTLTVQAGTPPLGATVKSYQWSSAATLTGSFTPIEGATANTYVLTADDRTRFVRVTVTWQKSGNADTPKTSATTVVVVEGTFATPPVPTITGTKTVGQTLTAVPGTWSPVPAFTYQWSSSATATGVYAPISGATNPTYQLTSTELGKFVKVTVTGTKAGYATLNVLSAAMTSAVVQAFTTAPTPTISGTVQVGQTLTAVPGTWSPVPAFTYQWKRNGSIITGATAYTYVLTAADRGAVISVDVKGTLATYEPTTKTSADTVEVASGVFTTASTPTITGSAALGSTLTAATVAWAPVATLTYAWYADDVVIPGATLATYMLPLTGTSMVGKQITVKVTGALSGYTSQTKTSDPTAAVTLALIPAAPTPTIMGPVKVGSTLTVQAGTPPLGATVKSYQWSSAATLTGSFTPIEGATANTYVLTASDVDKFIRVTVTWQKSGNADTPKTATTTVKVAALTFATPPVPTITGTKTVGQTLTAVPGTWSPVPAFTYQWSSSATATGVYAPISGATNPTYQLTSTELGKFVKVTVTGTKAGYATLNVLSAAMTSAVVQAFTTAPTPTISGTVQVGQTLTAVPGTWSPVPAFTYQWKRNGSIITGATAYTYVLTAADRGAVISVDVKGTLATYEPTTKTSADTVEVASGVFTTASTPTITGSAALGSTLTAATVAWAPVATLTYAWYADDVVIPGATLATYMLPLTGTSMVGKQITVKVTGALSGYTSQTKTSDPTAAVTLALIPAAPTPTIMGPVKVGSTLTVQAGTPPLGATVKSYQWSSAATLTGSFTPIEGATANTYVLTADDRTRFVRVTVTWQKSGNADTPKTSATTVVVVEGTFATPPVPTITGTKTVGQTLTANEGTWSPTTDSYTYQWSSSATATGTYAPISGATSRTYELTSADRGKFVKVTVTGVKAGFTSAPSLSAATSAVVAAFTTAPTPTISGTVRVGQTLTAVPGSWSPVPAFTYQWKRTVGSVTTNIATTATYVLTAADYDAVISVVVTGTLATYETTAKTSEATAAVAAGVFTTAPTPTITGSAQSGQTLTAVPGTWAPVATFTYQWLADEEVIVGATAATLPLTTGMVGKQISVAVTGAATRYTSQTKTSVATAAVTLPLIPAAPTPVISGTVKVGSTLTVAPGTTPLGAEKKSTQWSSAATLTGSFTPIEGATANTYVLTADDRTRFIRVTVTWEKSGNGDTPKSATTVAVAAGTFATPPIPTITGTKTVGSTLTANEGTWSPTTDSYTYQWSRASALKGPYGPISGATGRTYLLTSDDKYIRVTVTGTKSGYTTITSGPSAAATIITAG